MKFYRLPALLPALLAGVLFSCQAAEPPSKIPAGAAGAWEGEAKVVVSWALQKSLPVSVVIHPDGSVTGKVGDAELEEARLDVNRGWLGRSLNLATDYMITGRLSGAVIASESIVREAVSIPLNFRDGMFEGGVHTSGLKAGGKEHMILSASSLVLSKNNGREAGKAIR